MKKLTIAALLCCLLSGICAESESTSDELWALVASSDVIATGVLSVPQERILACVESNQPEYVALDFDLDEQIKGSSASRFAINWYVSTGAGFPKSEDVLRCHAQRVIVFLVDIEDAPSSGFHFAGNSRDSLSVIDPDRLDTVRDELRKQRQILLQFDQAFDPKAQPLYEEVKTLIDAMTQEETQMDAFRKLEAFGTKAVPAIIMLMDDRRDLAIGEIRLRNPPGHWEGFRIYGPRKIVDALAAILEQLAGIHFGGIANGGSERDRQREVEGWRLYLWHMRAAELANGTR